MSDNDLDACLRLIADQQRREILHQLRHDKKEKTTIDELIDQLNGRKSVSDTARNIDREHLVIQLYHSDLPKLDDHGVVEYDPEEETVRYQANEQIEVVLDSLSEVISQPTP